MIYYIFTDILPVYHGVRSIIVYFMIRDKSVVHFVLKNVVTVEEARVKQSNSEECPAPLTLVSYVTAVMVARFQTPVYQFLPSSVPRVVQNVPTMASPVVIPTLPNQNA